MHDLATHSLSAIFNAETSENADVDVHGETVLTDENRDFIRGQADTFPRSRTAPAVMTRPPLGIKQCSRALSDRRPLATLLRSFHVAAVSGACRHQGRMEGMTLTTFALVRHGQTDWNVQRRLQGSTDIPLNDVGRGQARDAVTVLSGYEWDAIVSSPLSRAAETANLIAAGLGLSVARRVPEFTERSFGPAEGLQAGPELDALRIPGGFRGAESEDETACRGLAALEALAEEFRGRRVLVVAHGSLIRVSLSRAIGRTLQSIDNAVLNLAHHHAVEGWQLEYFNGERAMAAVQG
jgi:uncharacterized phosphatase